MQVRPSALRVAFVLCRLLAALLFPVSATAQQGDIVLSVGEITSDDYPGQEFAGFGLSEAVLHQVVNLLGKAGLFSWCAARVIYPGGVAAADEELAFQQMPYVDPTTAAALGQVLSPDYVMSGSVTHSAGMSNWTIEVRSVGGVLVDKFEGFAPDDAILNEAAGIAEHLLDKLCPGPWTASGGGNGLVVSGTVVKLDEPFILDGTFPGGTGEFSYSPTAPGTGNVEYVLTGGGATGTGSGSYTIKPAGDGQSLTLRQTTTGCVNVGACRTNTDTITLTPVPR